MKDVAQGDSVGGTLVLKQGPVRAHKANIILVMTAIIIITIVTVIIVVSNV